MSFTKELKAATSKYLLMIFAICLIYFVLVIGTPAPPGLIYAASDSYLLSLPGASDLRSGILNGAMVQQNVDAYNTYLMSAIVILIANLVLYFVLFGSASTLSWNWLRTHKLSFMFFWRSLLANFLWLVVLVPILFLVYFLLILVGSLGSDIWAIAMNVVFYLCVMAAISCTLIFNRELHMPQRVSKVFSHAWASIKRSWWKLTLAQMVIALILFIATFLSYIPAMTVGFLTAILVLLLVLAFSWLVSYAAALG